jgi:aminomethyltransferase
MVPFAGWSMPVQYDGGQYGPGIIAEHLHCRAHAGLFDVSHMGQISLRGTGADRELEALVPADIAGLAMGRQRYTQFLNQAGGIIDDLMVSRLPDRLFLVVNAANADADLAHLRKFLPPQIEVIAHPDRALLALQGPEAGAVLARFVPATAAMRFMDVIEDQILGHDVVISRSGYTGEDGFEISLPADIAETFATQLLAHPEVALVGLGARDTLRLEAGLCLHGQDIGADTNPIEAGLAWSIQKRRRVMGDFVGADRVRASLKDGVTKTRVGIRPEGRAPARAHTVIVDEAGAVLGEVSSGGFSPTLNAPIAMGYLAPHAAAPGTRIYLQVRGQNLPATVVALPFVAHQYRTGDRP